MHLEELADALLMALGRVHDLLARLDGTGVHANERQLTEERVGGDLERQSGERCVHRGVAGQLDGLVADLVAVNLSDVERRRQVPVNGVEERLDTLVLVGGTTEHGEDLGVDNHLADGLVDFVLGEFLTGEVLLHELFVGLGDGLEELLVVFVGLVFEVVRDFLDGGL